MNHMRILGKTTPLAAMIAAASSLSALANEPAAKESPKQLETMIVVGEATNALITAEELENFQANDLGDVFMKDPSISVGGSVGVAQKIYIRGLEDAFINVTVDGAPQTSTLYHHIGRVTIDPALLKEVDVQAGAGEATAGFGAIGGAIRFKTKSANDLLAAGEKFGGKVKVSNFSNDGEQYSLSLYGRLTDDWGLVGYYNNLERNVAKDGDNNDIHGSGADQTLGFIKLSGNISDNQSLSISYEDRDEDGRFTARPNWVYVPGRNDLFDSEAKRETLTANYGLFLNEAINLEVTAYDTESAFRGGRFDFLATIESYGFDIRNTSRLGIHRFTYGVEYRDDQVESGYAIPQPEEDHGENGDVLGIYAQAHSQVTPQLLLSYGLRYDKYDYQQEIRLPDYYGDPITDEAIAIDSSEVSINAGLLYDINDAWTFGLGYAEASRGKEIGDGFTLDAYLYDRSSEPMIDPNLKPEKVANIESSLRYRVGSLDARLAVFQSEIDDTILEHDVDSARFENIGTVKSRGLELDIAYLWNDFEFYAGFATVDSELEPAAGLYAANYSAVDLSGYEFDGLGNSRGDTWNLGVEYRPMANLKFGANLTYVEELNIKTLYQDLDKDYVDELYNLEKPSYSTVDLFAQWMPTDALTINLSIINAFDKLYRDHSSVGDYSEVPGYGMVVGHYEPGRDIRLSVTYQF
ncbi:TonB-dependent receptor [Spongiibacter taiwanensis]|uniref:TonB-dependent receptor plug domain-containing protein n=1 Tax=Spongiibacter taiwanensis TaxID=1748242 RepID=UPI002035A6F7|nr:TonB-dependent receptor [Spongiibacter taiwanensis]USA42670.1 TonB-dependent receptor [Spongiibacter taiwanensis]